jgi:NAD(P) transhydrogenase subunit alpha
MRVGIVKEIRPGERRVAVTPETVAKLSKLGFDVLIESGAGEAAAFSDGEYEKSGAQVSADTRAVWAADILLKVQPPEANPSLGCHEAELLKPGATLISFIWPHKNKELVERLSARGATVLAMDQIPRISRAQKMDALSSMANIAGYRAVIEAASFFGRFFTGQMTAAGKVPPAKVLVIGAGVAGLSAIGAARGLGAVVRAFDTRPAVREQVLSMGAEFLEVKIEEDGSGEGGYAREMSPAFIAAEMALFEAQAREVDILITTALIPGKPAPQLITEKTVELMRPGSVIVDLAAEAGGNCALTQPGAVINHKGVTIIGYVDMPSRLAPTASALYGNNLTHLLADMGGAKSWHIDEADEVVRGALILREGTLMWPPPKPASPPPQDANAVKKPAPRASSPSIPALPAVKAAGKSGKESGHAAQRISGRSQALALSVIGVVLLGLGAVAPPAFLAHFTVFVLSCFVGWQVVWNVTPALHTPLMSVTNAISGIIVLGGMLKIAHSDKPVVIGLGVAAVLLSAINIAGGFLVTQRMLRMFQK